MNVSIVTAAFRAATMDRVVDSILKQTHEGWEWIVVNDNQEGIRAWWANFTQSDKYNAEKMFFIDVCMDKGRFGLYSRNIGAIAARHKHLVFLDDDNEWTDNHIKSMVELKEKTGKNPYCQLHIKGKKEGSTFERVKGTSFVRQHIDLGCLLWQRKWFDVYGGFRDDSQVTFDWNFMARVHFGEGPHQFVPTGEPTLIFHHKRY